MDILRNKLINDAGVFDRYSTYTEALHTFKTEMLIDSDDLAESYFTGAFAYYMTVITNFDLIDQYDFHYVLAPEELDVIIKLAKERVRNPNIEPGAETVFSTAFSKRDFDQIYNWFFGARSGSFQLSQANLAFRLAAQMVGIEGDDADVISAVNALPLWDYRKFMVYRASMLKTVEPQLYELGLQRHRDYIKGILIAPDNFLINERVAGTEFLREKAHIVSRLAEKDVQSATWRDLYFEQLDKSLLSRCKARGVDLQPPPVKMEWHLVPFYLRHNRRVAIGDIDALFWDWPIVEEEFGIGDVVKIVASVAATWMIGGAIFNMIKGGSNIKAANDAANVAEVAESANTVVSIAPNAATGTVQTIAQPASQVAANTVAVEVPANYVIAAEATATYEVAGVAYTTISSATPVTVAAVNNPGFWGGLLATAKAKTGEALIGAGISTAINKPLQKSMLKDQEKAAAKQELIEAGIRADKQAMLETQLEIERARGAQTGFQKELIYGGMLVAVIAMTL